MIRLAAIRHPRRLATAAALAALLLSVGACSTKKPVSPGPCPRVNILADASQLTQFKEGPGRDLIDVDHTARIARVGGTCVYEMDKPAEKNKKPETGTLTVTIGLLIAAERGPADTDHKARFEYFVTLVDRERQPIQKTVFPVTVDFPGNVTRATAEEFPIDLKIRLKPKQTGADFVVFVGFQLSPEQVEFNRRREREARGR